MKCTHALIAGHSTLVNSSLCQNRCIFPIIESGTDQRQQWSVRGHLSSSSQAFKNGTLTITTAFNISWILLVLYGNKARAETLEQSSKALQATAMAKTTCDCEMSWMVARRFFTPEPPGPTARRPQNLQNALDPGGASVLSTNIYTCKDSICWCAHQNKYIYI